MIGAIVQRLRNHGTAAALTYSLGRFSSVRRGYGIALGHLQQFGGIPGLRSVGQKSLFAGTSAQRVANEIQTQSAAFGLQLPAELVFELATFARGARLLDWTSRRQVEPQAIKDGKLDDGSPVFVADVLGTDLQPAAIRVARDPLLLDALGEYLRYRPVGVDIRMLRSFVVDAPLEQRRRSQTVDYHFDVHGYNFVYANFYITDVDVDSGAHEMILGSHNDKPVRWLWGGARRDDAAILSHYGAARVRLIEGPAGSGFVQDSSCYHRVYAPSKRERLMLHLRYY